LTAHEEIELMENLSSNSQQSTSSGYRFRTPEDYLKRMEPEVLASFTPDQLRAIKSTLKAAIPQAAPKTVDLRIGIDLILFRFYVVLLVGRDRRRQQRYEIPGPVSRLGNAIAAILLLISINLLISLFILLFAYLVKSALGIDFFPHKHLGDLLEKFY
jgi:hypothetical protein